MDRYARRATLPLAAGAVGLALLLHSPGGLPSQPAGSVPPLLSEPAGVPGAGLVLAPDGLGPVTFGEPEPDVLATLIELLGDPVEDTTQPCGSTDVRLLRWGNLTIALLNGTFNGYISGIYFPPDSPEMMIATAEGVGLRATPAELDAAYGDRLTWRTIETDFGAVEDAFGIDGFDIQHPSPAGLGGYVQGGRESGQVISFIGGQPCLSSGPSPSGG